MSENPPAFPSEQHECQDGSWNQTYDSGMSLRDWFAGQALAGLSGEYADGEYYSHVAKTAYSLADAMLAERQS